MYSCTESWLKNGTMSNLFVYMLLSYAPLFVGIIAGYTAYKLTVNYCIAHAGLAKVKAEYEADGFRFEYKGANFHVKRAGFGNRKYYNGQKCTVYVNTKNPQIVQECSNTVWITAGIVAAFVVFFAVYGLLRFINFGITIC